MSDQMVPKQKACRWRFPRRAQATFFAPPPQKGQGCRIWVRAHNLKPTSPWRGGRSADARSAETDRVGGVLRKKKSRIRRNKLLKAKIHQHDQMVG